MNETNEAAAKAQAVHHVLDGLGINYAEIKHPPVFTASQAIAAMHDIDGQGCKSLLLTTKSHDRYILVLIPDTINADTKKIAKLVGSAHLSFASPKELKQLLDLTPGSVSPFGLINDNEGKVEAVIDQLLVDKQLLFHPNTNTRTVSISYNDLLRFITEYHHNYIVGDCAKS